MSPRASARGGDQAHGIGPGHRGALLSATAFVGVSGARRNACAAVCVDGDLRAACEQERLTRVRQAGVGAAGLPAEAVTAVLALAPCDPRDVTSYVVAERGVRLPKPLPSVAVDHHRAHAAAAFLTSAWPRATVIVCDSTEAREVSVWRAEGAHLRDCAWPWRGRGFATLYSDCAELFGFTGTGAERELEACAHLGQGLRVEEMRTLFRYEDGGVRLAPGWRTTLYDMVQAERQRNAAGLASETASAVQRRIGELLLEFVTDVAAAVGGGALCVGGGLFYNTYFTTLLSASRLFAEMFVPINPGNAGLAVGATLLLAHEAGAAPTAPVSPFLGPAYDEESIKATLDGCKLSYSFLTPPQVLDATVDALTRGYLVGWFDGRMEWGPRALGHRSILADPRSPYVLDNLNGFLRKRERWRAFGVSVNADSVPRFLCGPPSAPFMEYEYGLRDDRLRHVVPRGATSIRVQTVGPELGQFWALHRRMEQATGTGAIVNTSFNGFHEPIACTPRDAVRVFYGTGLDMLVMGRFVLRK